MAHPLVRAGALVAGAGAGAFAWALTEARHGFVVREFELPSRVSAPLTVLHISDLHLTTCDTPRIEFVRSLAALQFDVVALTGDNFGGSSGPEALSQALEPLLDHPGAFVFGSNDYHAPVIKNPIRYFWARGVLPRRDDGTLPASEFADFLRGHGWVNLNNARGRIDIDGKRVALVGVDDPHVARDEYPVPDSTVAMDDADARLALIHAPYAHVLDAAWQEGCDLALVGHTHGGQLCVPGYGALVTNSEMPRWRASGLQGWPVLRPDGEIIAPRRVCSPIPRTVQEASAQVIAHSTRDSSRLRVPDAMWLNISAGLGTSPYTPVRVACPPEVSLLHLVPSER